MALLLLLLSAMAAAPGRVIPQPLPPHQVSAFHESARAKGAEGAAATLSCQELVSELQLCFRVEEGEALRFVTEADVAAWQMSPMALRASAASAPAESPLKKRAIEGGGAFYEIEAASGFEALVLLHPEWLAALGPRPRVAFPARGVAMAWGSSDPEVDHIMAVAARQAFEQYPGPISPVVLSWDAGRWQTWGEAKPKPVPAPL